MRPSIRNSVSLALLGLAALVHAALAQDPSADALRARTPQADAPEAAPEGTAAAEPTSSGSRERDRALALWLSRGESDNVGRTVVPEDGSYDGLGLLARLAHTSTRLAANLDSNVEFRTYSEEGIDDEIVGTLAGVANIQIVPDLFSWDFRENLGQGLNDQFAAIGPNNRERINVFSSGPELELNLGSRTILQIGGDYSARRYDMSQNVDADSVTYEIGAFRQASQTATFGIVASSTDVDYTDFASPPYKIDRATLRYEKQLATGRVLADVGTNEITYRSIKSSEPAYSFLWSRSLTARSDLSVTANRAFTDSGTLTAPTLVQDPVNVGEVVVSADPLEQTAFAVTYVLTMSRTVIQLTAGTSDEEYVAGSTRTNNEVTTSRAALQRMVTPRLSFGATFEKLRRDYNDSALPLAGDEESNLNAWVDREVGRKFNVALAWSRYERRGTQTFDENRYELRFGYSPTRSGTAGLATLGR